MRCPQCQEQFSGSKCDCGYSPHHKRDLTIATKMGRARPDRVPIKLRTGAMVYLPRCNKQPCEELGLISPSTNFLDSDDAPWFCKYHFFN